MQQQMQQGQEQPQGLPQGQQSGGGGSTMTKAAAQSVMAGQAPAL